MTRVFFRPGFLAGCFLARCLLGGGFLWAGTILVGRSGMMTGAMLGAGGKPGVGTVAGSGMGAFTGAEIGVFVVVGFEFGFLIVIRFQLGLLVVVPLDRAIALVKVEVFTVRSVLPRTPVLETSFELDRSMVTAIGGRAACDCVGDLFFRLVFLGSPGSAAGRLWFVHGRLSLSDREGRCLLPILKDISFHIFHASLWWMKLFLGQSLTTAEWPDRGSATISLGSREGLCCRAFRQMLGVAERCRRPSVGHQPVHCSWRRGCSASALTGRGRRHVPR